MYYFIKFFRYRLFLAPCSPQIYFPIKSATLDTQNSTVCFPQTDSSELKHSHFSICILRNMDQLVCICPKQFVEKTVLYLGRELCIKLNADSRRGECLLKNSLQPKSHHHNPFFSSGVRPCLVF